FLHFGPETLGTALRAVPAGEVAAFRASWDDLPPDTHLGTDRPYRFRRYGSFRVHGSRLERLPHAAFFQHGTGRLFAPLTASVAEGAVLRALVLALRELLPGPREGIDTCGVHQIRVTATADAEGHPAPEGMHRDGHAYVAQVLIRRQDVLGAESSLHAPGDAAGGADGDADGARVLHRALLSAPLETIVLDDRRVLHGVSPLRPAPGAARGIRDMLLVDFFSAAESESHSGDSFTPITGT
ncbi:2OG-Fe dioxygenase family protein, partial [Streptomyces sp. UNOC14_S4]|uniref:2OG-Fe dioxygenase family protein n=1 Tax=Streptomyces sp. UNOC14_S4 TaxID=2872340 RepID=UPI001E4D59BB